MPDRKGLSLVDKIKISKGATTIEMPRVRKVMVGGQEVAKEIEMASGKKVKEARGFRPIVTAEWDWLPAQTIADLHTLLRQGGYFQVEYPDPALGDTSGMFSVSYPETKIFKFNGTEPRWHGVSLTMTAQEVV